MSNQEQQEAINEIKVKLDRALYLAGSDLDTFVKSREPRNISLKALLLTDIIETFQKRFSILELSRLLTEVMPISRAMFYHYKYKFKKPRMYDYLKDLYYNEQLKNN